MKTCSKVKSIGCIFLVLVIFFSFTASAYANQTYMYILSSSSGKSLNLYNNGTAKINLYNTVGGKYCIFSVGRISGAKPYVVSLVSPSNVIMKNVTVTGSGFSYRFAVSDVKGNYKVYIRNIDTNPSKNIYTQLNHTFKASTIDVG